MRNSEKRITINSEQHGGLPCILGSRIKVSDVLDLLANGRSVDELLEEMPDLERDDIYASLRFASRNLDNPMTAARGMWKDRTDLPDFAELRREMDRVVEDE
jgi:uncharacterized protein (DUF433 family)